MTPTQIKSLQKEIAAKPYDTLLTDITTSGADLLQKEINILKAELKNAAPDVKKFAIQIGTFGTLFIFSLFPLLAAAVIGLGHLIDDQYGYSALLIGVVLALVGGFFGMKSLRNLQKADFTFAKTRAGLTKAMQLIEGKIEKIKTAAKKGDYVPDQFN